MQTLEEKIRALPPDLQREIEDFVEFLVEKRRHMAPAIVWPPGYFEEVVGSIPDFPEIDGDMGGIDPALDETDAGLTARST